MIKKLTALLLASCLVLLAVPVFAGAATGQQVTANAVTVTAGNTATVTLKAENFASVATVEVYVYYDPTVLTLSSTANGSLLSGAQSSVNTAEAGTVKLVVMSLNGISGTGNLLSLYFKTASDCTPGMYPVKVAVGNAYGEGIVPVTIGSTDGSITVNKPVATETFSIYGYPSAYTVKKGDTLSYRVASASSSRAFVSGDFTVEYDHEVFAFDSVTLESALTGEGAIWSVNSSVLGQVRIAYAKDLPVKSFYLFAVNLKVIADTDGTTTVRAEANNMYREDLTTYLPGSDSNTLTLQKLPQIIDYPNASLETENLIQGQKSQSVFTLEAGAGVAAADFTLTYNPEILRCVSVGITEIVQEKGGMVILNDNYADGKIRFSYIHMDAYSQTDLPLVNITWEPLQSPAQHYQVIASAVGVVDTQQTPVILEYVTATGCIYVETVTEPTCEADGSMTYACTCGNTLPPVVIPIQHPWDDGVYTAPTYEADAYTTYTCTSCGEVKIETEPGTQLQPAAILHHPQATTAETGETVTFSVVAANTAVSWKWQYRKIYKWFDTSMEGCDTDTLTVPAVGSRNGYDYRCIITFADGTVLTSEPAELTVNTYITGVKDPNDQTVVLGYKGQFTTSAVGESIKYQWQYCRPGSEKWIDTAMEGATKPTVMIETTTARDGYQYRCRITDVTGKIVYTEPATMRVLSVKGQPQAAYAPVDGTAYFTVMTSVSDGFTYQWQYSRNGGSSWSNTTMDGYNTATLAVGATKARNGYLYRCVLTGSKNSKIYSEGAALTVSDPVEITGQPADVTAAVGTTAVFKVTATNVLSYRWQYARKGSESWQNTSLSGYATNTLSVEVLTSRNGYRYRCVITGMDGIVYYSDEATLAVG